MKTIKTTIIPIAIGTIAAAMIFSTATADHSNSDNITLNVKIYDDYEYAVNVKYGDFEIKVLDMMSNNEVGFTQATKNFNIGLQRNRRYLIYVSRDGYLTKFFEVSTDGANAAFEHTFFVDMVLMKKTEMGEYEMNYPSAIVTCGAETDDEFDIQDIGTFIMYLKTLLPVGDNK